MLKNIGSNWLLMVATAAAVYVLTPFVINSLGADAYGLWLIIVALTGYLTLIRGGMPISSVRAFSRRLGKDDIDGFNQAVASSLVVFLILSCLVILGGAILFGVFEVAFSVPEGLRPQARIAFIIVVFTTAVNFPGHVPLTIMEAHDDFVVRNIVQFVSLLVRLGLTIGLLTIEPNLSLLALALLGSLLVEVVVSIVVIKRLYPKLDLRIKSANKPMMMEIAKTGGAILIIMLGGQLAYRTDNLVIGGFLQMEDVAVYGLANNLTMQLMEMIFAIGTVVMPRATKLMSAQEDDEVLGLTMRWSKIALTLTLAPAIYLLVLGSEFISWWINPELGVPAGELLLIILPSFFLFFPARGVCEPILIAAGKLRIPAIASLISGLVNLGISIALVGPFGLVGVALGTAIPTGLLGILLMVLATREIGASLWRYLGYIYLRNIIGAVPSVAFLLWCKYTFEPSTFLSLFGIGGAMLIIFGLTQLVIVYTRDPHLDVHLKLRQMLRRFRRG